MSSADDRSIFLFNDCSGYEAQSDASCDRAQVSGPYSGSIRNAAIHVATPSFFSGYRQKLQRKLKDIMQCCSALIDIW